MTGLLLVLALAQPVDVSRPLLVYGGSALADAGSTLYAKSRGARELHPWMQSNASLAGWKAAQALALTGIDVALQKRGHKGKARVLRVAAAIVGASLAVHNVRVAHRQGRQR